MSGLRPDRKAALTEGATAMLGDAPAAAMIPTKDRARARDYYENTLGLKLRREFDGPGGGFMFDSAGSMIMVYETFEDITAKHTLATWRVDDIGSEMAALRSKGITFEEYDFPGMKTVNGVLSDETMGKACWFKDPDGNILSVIQEA